MKVLIVEQEATLHQSLAIFLEKCRNFEVASAHCQQDALALWRKDSFDLVLAGDTLPDGDGLEMLKVLKESNPDLVAVLMTARDEPSLVRQVQQFGLAGCLVKPFDIRQLEALIGVVGS